MIHKICSGDPILEFDRMVTGILSIKSPSRYHVDYAKVPLNRCKNCSLSAPILIYSSVNKLVRTESYTVSWLNISELPKFFTFRVGFVTCICFFCLLFVAIFFYLFSTAIYSSFETVSICFDILELALVFYHHLSKCVLIQREYGTFSKARLILLRLLLRDSPPLKLK